MAAAIGAGVGLLTSVNDSAQSRRDSILVSALTGLVISACARALTSLCWPRIGAWSGARRRAAVMALLLVSGVLAWGVQLAVIVWLVSGLPSLHHGLVNLALTEAMALGFGFAFYSFDRTRTSLEQSVARLKEVEFAEKELLLARELQARLLPPREVRGEGYRTAARNLPALIVAGDFYDVFRLDDGAVGVVVADVAGKGMAAALIMASVKAMLPLVAAERGAAETLRELNRRLADELMPRQFVALAFASYDPAAGKLSLANAGLPDPYLLRRDAASRALVVPGPRLPLGVRREVEYQQLEVAFGAGERLLLVTDGLAEAQVASGEPLGYGALAALLQAEPWAAEPLSWLDAVLASVRRATAPALADDWTALVLQPEPLTAAGGATAAREL